MPQLVRVFKVDRRKPADAFGVDVRRRDALAERQRRQQRQLRSRIKTVDIRARIRFRVSQALRFGQHRREVRTVAFDLGEDVVAGAVQDAVQRLHAIPGDAFPQHGVDRNSAGDTGLHRQVDFGRDGPIPNVGALQRHQFLVSRDNALAVGDGAFNDLARGAGAADEFSHHVDVGMGHHLPPVGGPQRGRRNIFQFLCRDPTTAHSHYVQAKPELLGDLFGVFSENVERTATHIPQPHDPNIDVAHIVHSTINPRAGPESAPTGYDERTGMIPARRSLLTLLPGLGWVFSAPAQIPDEPLPRHRGEEDTRLPNGKLQRDEILKADHEKNLQDAAKLIDLSTQIKDALEKNTQYVLALDDLKRLDEIEKVAKRLRSRIRKY